MHNVRDDYRRFQESIEALEKIWNTNEHDQTLAQKAQAVREATTTNKAQTAFEQYLAELTGAEFR